MPSPPAAVAAMKMTRRMSGSIPSRRPEPRADGGHRPALWRSRRSGGGARPGGPAALMSAMFSGPLSVARPASPIASMIAPTVPRMAGGNTEAQGGVDLVEQQQDAEPAHDEPGDQRGGVELPRRVMRPPGNRCCGRAPRARPVRPVRPARWADRTRRRGTRRRRSPSASKKPSRSSVVSWTIWSSPTPTWPSITSRLAPPRWRRAAGASRRRDPPLSRSSTRA